MPLVQFLLILLIALNKIASGSTASVTGSQPSTNPRVKREGFGPWEAQETWDERGKTVIGSMNITDIIKRVVLEEAEVIKNATVELVTKIEEPFIRLSHSYVFRAVVLLIFVLLLIKIVSICKPLLKVGFKIVSFIFKPFLWLFTFLVKITTRTSCCIHVATMWPVYKIRLWYFNHKLNREIVVTNRDDYEMTPLVSTSEIYTDASGPYLMAPGNCKIYFHKSPLSTHDFLNLNQYPSAPERIGGATKETVLVNSKFRSIDTLPAFQGQFMVDGIVIGHFSRIKYQGKDCIITAHHVLSYNQGSHIQIVNKNNSVDLCDVPCNLIAYSHDTHFDWVVYELPSAVFSRLGLRVGKIAKTLKRGAAIQIHQIYEGGFVYSMGIPFKHETLPWHMKYRASTIQGSSGAPILNVRQEIVGIHLEGSDTINTGVVPAIFRNSRKESIGNDDLFAGDLSYAKYTSYSKEQNLRDIEEMGYYEVSRDDAKYDYVSHFGTNWGKIMDDNDENFDYNYIGIGTEPGRGQKESPWTCSTCNLLHLEKRFDCSSCGAPLKKLKTQQHEKTTAFNQTSAAQVLPDLVLDKVTSDLKSLFERMALTEQLVSQHLAGEVSSRAQRRAFIASCPQFTKELADKTGWIFPQNTAETQFLGRNCDENWDQNIELAVTTPQDCETLIKLPNAKFSERPEVNRKETATLMLEPTIKNKIKRKRKNKKKIVKLSPEVSVKETVFQKNQAGPATPGDNGSAGVQQKQSSQNSVQSLETALALSEQVNLQYKMQLGKAQSLLTQLSSLTAGQTAQQMQNVLASSCNATNSSRVINLPRSIAKPQ